MSFHLHLNTMHFQPHFVSPPPSHTSSHLSLTSPLIVLGQRERETVLYARVHGVVLPERPPEHILQQHAAQGETSAPQLALSMERPEGGAHLCCTCC